MKKYKYLTNCVDSDDGPGIADMVDQAREITWETFRHRVSVSEVKAKFPLYWEINAKPAHIKDDWSVRFYSSEYKGKRCYFIDHSAIEYIWVAQEETRRGYTYKVWDGSGDRIKRTRGEFAGWTEPTGLLNTKYAIFKNPKTTLFVPSYLLTPETRVRIKEEKDHEQEN